MNIKDVDFEVLINKIKSLKAFDYIALLDIIKENCPGIDDKEIVEVLIDLKVVDRSIIPNLAHKYAKTRINPSFYAMIKLS